MHDPSSTLIAVATPTGRGGVGCVRISGPDALVIGRKLFRPSGGGEPEEPGRAVFGRFSTRDGEPLDHGYRVVFEGRASYTGELTVELWPHGSPAVLAELLEAALAAGAVAAGPGEFTYRGLCNGRLDLTRAEAVRDLVEARTVYQARIAFAQAEGSVSRRLAPLRQLLEEWIARGEAAVEFVDESETRLPAGELQDGITRASDLCAGLLAGFRAGRVLRDGATLAMIGLPNVGKSSLFNRLLARDRAIVTEVAGTTRDTLEETLDLDGIPVRLVDTAGLRDSADRVEIEGVRRAERAREEADLVLLVLDGSRPLEALEREYLERGGIDGTARHTIVVNKSDLPRSLDLPPGRPEPLPVSSVTGAGIGELRARLRERLTGGGLVEDPVVTNTRHAQALERARDALGTARDAVASGLSEELVLEDLREARRHLGTITGELSNEELYDRIFSTFCIGK